MILEISLGLQEVKKSKQCQLGLKLSIQAIKSNHWHSESIRRAQYLTIQCCSLSSRPQQKHPQLPNFAFIIITSRHQHGYPWPSLATSPYRPLPPVGLQGYISCRQRPAVCKFLLVVPAFARLCEGVHRSISLMSSFLLLPTVFRHV